MNPVWIIVVLLVVIIIYYMHQNKTQIKDVQVLTYEPLWNWWGWRNLGWNAPRVGYYGGGHHERLHHNRRINHHGMH